MAKTKSLCIVLLRLLALGATTSAAVVMATSRETTFVLNLPFYAKFTDSPAFMYFLVTNGVASIYSLLALFVPSESWLGHLVMALDAVVSMLLTSGISVVLAIGYVGKKGNPHAGWLPICNQVPKFCDHVSGATIAGVVGAAIYFVLHMYTLVRTIKPLLG
ncbi:hypothetical protein Syun_027454 [Stephania yunnanensis]|uniref:CASP-like protein n=1 Tax=Stephania yunnanensis TaxID=152371 RepID=A0AAP0EMX8_9MAGN